MPLSALCLAQAEQEDNLSLLDGVTARVMRQYEKKGIFTVKQLSYLFKPRKRKKGRESHPQSRIRSSYKPWRYASIKSISKNCLRYLDSPLNCLWTWKGSPIGLYYLIGRVGVSGRHTEHHALLGRYRPR